MSIRKRNEFLDGGDSEEELENGSDSDAEEGRVAIGGHANKRRKVDTESERSLSEAEDEVTEKKVPEKTSGKGKRAKEKKSGKGEDTRFDFSNFENEELPDDDAPQDHDDEPNDDTSPTLPLKPAKKSSDLKQYEAAQRALRKSGVIYISRVPPFMKPHTLKHLLSPHAPSGLNRVFLTPEDPTQHTKRVKNGGNKKKSFTDGWVEFTSKSEAKLAAELLNGNIIGGKKGGFYHDDLWNVKYLRGFKWNHLTEQVANENAERAARTLEEIRRTRKENKAFVEDVEKGKMLEGMEGKARRKRERGGGGGEVRRRKLEFTQRKAKRGGEEGDGVGNSKVLGMIF
ncbi:hypothetical protein TI39_contig671g00008 [Zymoseptoria brevis]|uniref:18S rRNA factor 2 n=1 Tax=Zymoseptoria brevis TaxID=1047168 RepID=A0A0F4GFY0_9PEZI|nr:hypothetical protein TI39_contig671g00008 [Zymoseptoria brevis]